MNTQNPSPQNFNAPYQPTGGAPENPGKGFSVAALVLGIISCVLAWFYMVNIAALVTSILGLIFAVVGNKRAKAVGASNGLGIAGLVLSIVGLSIAGIGFVSCTLCVACVGNAAASVFA